MSAANQPGAACIPNIGVRERNKRRTMGLVLSAVGVVGAIALSAFDISRLWRLTLFLPLWAGALALLQARERT